MPPEPATKRTVAFVNGQNLFLMPRHAFGYAFPNYDPLALAEVVIGQRPGWELVATRLYTGVPDPHDSPLWNHFCSAKLAVLGTRDVVTFSRPLRHGKEKGIDVRIALDIVHLARLQAYDVALIFSQDQVLSEAADEVRGISDRAAAMDQGCLCLPFQRSGIE